MHGSSGWRVVKNSVKYGRTQDCIHWLRYVQDDSTVEGGPEVQYGGLVERQIVNNVDRILGICGRHSFFQASWNLTRK
jgi:hypothetical protein